MRKSRISKILAGVLDLVDLWQKDITALTPLIFVAPYEVILEPIRALYCSRFHLTALFDGTQSP